ncbi:MAG: DUF1573 domain-containing protein [Planctomycetia bacterium]|nr:DUF1573 domain-containing protein [Planctomycetia bacterium]
MPAAAKVPIPLAIGDPRRPSPMTCLERVVRAIALLVFTLANWALTGCGGAPGSLPATTLAGPSTSKDVSASPERLDLGTVVQGGQTEGFFDLINPTAALVEIRQFEVSCKCLRIEPASLAILAGDSRRCRAVLNMSIEPEFTGQLSIRIDAFDSNRECVFKSEFFALVEDSGNGMRTPMKLAPIPLAEDP